MPRVWLPGEVKLIVWVPTTKKDFGWVGAAAKLALPGWDAVMMHVPGATRLSVLPLTVHTEDVLELNCTVRPDVAVAERADAGEPRYWVLGCVKEMVCVACDTVTLRVTGVAAL